MPADRRTYVRWLTVGIIALVAESSIALVAIQVVGQSPAQVGARSTVTPPVSPSPSPSPSANPLARSAAAAAFYPPEGKVVLFGGITGFPQNGPAQVSAETWTWDGMSWQQLHPVNSPPGRHGEGLVYDQVHQVLVLYGGQGADQGFLTDTWTWNGTNWTQMSPSQSPPTWFFAPMTYDATRKATLLYVGSGSWPLTPPNQTWSWDGSTWTLVPTTTDPNGVNNINNSTIVYDSARAQTLLVSGSGTWVLGAGGWRRLTGGGPQITNNLAIVDDEARGELVEVGANGDTWTWDGKAWIAKNPSVAPSARIAETLVNDPIHKQVVLFGGGTAGVASTASLTSETWVWDGNAWKQVS
jgi:hypothetical protein